MLHLLFPGGVMNITQWKEMFDKLVKYKVVDPDEWTISVYHHFSGTIEERDITIHLSQKEIRIGH